ncbi:damage-control phosphatase At2g17340-like isoform X5 [Malus domestica]|uniref:damage-control phosphatase At2g17340-like isoform X5 n=1 Tax=Malus domestica TaxID=3750 RepID=UPI0039760C29
MKAQWQQLQRKRAESGASVPDAPARPEKFAQRYTEILEDLKKDLESHSGPPDCILLCRLREQVLRELGFQDIFKKVKGFIENKLIQANVKGEMRQRLALLITLECRRFLKHSS